MLLTTRALLWSTGTAYWAFGPVPAGLSVLPGRQRRHLESFSLNKGVSSPVGRKTRLADGPPGLGPGSGLVKVLSEDTV